MRNVIESVRFGFVKVFRVVTIINILLRTNLNNDDIHLIIMTHIRIN
jgi:hypothetical protein